MPEIKYQMLENEVLTILGYFDYFHYPLTKAQLFQFSSLLIQSESELDTAIESLLKDKRIECLNAYYSLSNIQTYAAQREEGELRYVHYQARITKTTKRLSKFPFVKFVGLSGSLSKGYAQINADIDLFVVTEKNRLWICRTLLHIMKKLSFLKGSQHWYCMNYFVDETALQIEEQNFFTAIELTTLKPLADESNLYFKLIEANRSWIKSYLPNFSNANLNAAVKIHPNFMTSLFKMIASDALNLWLMNVTDKKWRKKWTNKNYPVDDYDLAFKTRLNISKNHLHNYQKKLMKHLDTIRS